MAALPPEDDKEERVELGRRIGIVATAFGSRVQAARVAGITPQHLRRLIKGEAQTAAVTLGRLARAAGYDAHWVLTGEGPERRPAPGMQLTAAEATHAYGRSKFFGRVHDAIAKAYREASIAIPPEEIARLAFEEYTDVVGAARDETLQIELARAVGARYRRDLAARPPP